VKELVFITDNDDALSISRSLSCDIVECNKGLDKLAVRREVFPVEESKVVPRNGGCFAMTPRRTALSPPNRSTSSYVAHTVGEELYSSMRELAETAA